LQLVVFCAATGTPFESAVDDWLMGKFGEKRLRDENGFIIIPKSFFEKPGV